MASSSSNSGYIYDVFLSFSGDTRKKFTDHLYTALVQAGIYTFRDNDELFRGECLKPELEKAIKRSRSSIVVFSKGYASSAWCLDELVMILQCRMSGQWVFPIFYDVDPSDARHQKGAFAEAFAVHEKRMKSMGDQTRREWMQKIQIWREALRSAADLTGKVLKNEADGHEARFIQDIVKIVEGKLHVVQPCSDHFEHLVGIFPRVRNIHSWLRDCSTGIGIVAICGMGGIGKTTIARFVYNFNLSIFEGGCFLENIRETSAKPNGLVHLQQKVLSHILGTKIKVEDAQEGTRMIQRTLHGKRLLLVLDDLDEVEQLHALLGKGDWLLQGSKIIITARDDQLLKGYDVSYKTHMVEMLNNNESFKLFSWYAFGQDYPVESYVEDSLRLVHYCGGLPLALKVLGSFLRGRDEGAWKSAIEKLKVIPENNIFQVLKISFDYLDQHEKDIFLHIACFFTGKRKDFVVKVLDGCYFFTTIGIQILKDRCLVTVDENNKVGMHQLLRDMGRQIIHLESPTEPGKVSRLWNHRDSLLVLGQKLGTEAIQGLMLDMDIFKEESYNFCCEAKFEIDAFERMHRLQILLLNHVELTGSYKAFPKTLKWLSWGGFPLQYIPSGYPLESLVALDMPFNSLKYVWDTKQVFPSLKILDLRHSLNLSTSPDFSPLPNLEMLILKGCAYLIEIHNSVGDLKRLALLNLKGCERLRKLPKSIVKLKFLETLIISGCSNLTESPVELKKMESLKVLLADGVPIDRLLNIVEVKPQNKFLWSRKSNPEPCLKHSWASLPHNLVSLSLANCNLSDDAFPRKIGNLPFLKNLNLSTNPIRRLPGFIRDLATLRTLQFQSCWELQSLERLPDVCTLVVADCTSLSKITYQSTSFRLQETALANTHNLVEVQNWFKVEPIDRVDVEMINVLGLNNVESLDNVEVMYTNNLLGAFYTKISHVQGFYEYGIFSTFFPGEVNPDWLEHKSSGTSLISFIVPSFPSPSFRIQGLNVCSVYSLADDEEHENQEEQLYNVLNNPQSLSSNPLFCIITNKSKNLKWIYGPSFLNIPDIDEDMIWLSHWKVGNQLETGDEVSVLVVGEAPLKVKEFGVKLVSRQEELETQQDPVYPSSLYGIGGDMTAYEVRKGVYFLCNEALSRVYDSSSKVWSSYLIGDSIENTHPDWNCEITDSNEDVFLANNEESATETDKRQLWYHSLTTIQMVLIKFLCCFSSSH